MLKTLLDAVALGYKVDFQQNDLFIDITVYKHLRNKFYRSNSSLPLDHMYEEKVSDCIQFMLDELHKDIENA